MSKITPDHIRQKAFVYIRQSSLDQVQNHLESQRRQYALVDRAKGLGFKDVIVIDEDLGISGSGCSERAGFSRLLDEICQGKVGAVFSLEASRLARNGREWHSLLEICSLLNTLIIDHDGIYDPSQPNDRLLLGMKGTLSEMELSTFRQRSQEALKLKASRGELYTIVPVGYIRTQNNRIEKDPDVRVQKAIELVFQKFHEYGSARQVLLWFQQEGLDFPGAANNGPDGCQIRWERPTYSQLIKLFKNPAYAGAYAYGRTKTIATIQNGRKKLKRGVQKSQEDWDVLLIDNHDGYISWDEYQQNKKVLMDNNNMRGCLSKGAARKGESLLAGLLRCGHCGRKLSVYYCGGKGKSIRYVCRGAMHNQGTTRCISFGGIRVDAAVLETVFNILNPIGIEAALNAVEELESEMDARIEQKELSLQQARYEADRIRRQYDAVDPANRLVAGELESRWNEALLALDKIEDEISRIREENCGGIDEQTREDILSLGQDLPIVWNHPSSDSALKKRIIRTLIHEIVVYIEGEKIRLIIHWEGGDHTELETAKPRKGQHQCTTDEETGEIIREVSRMMPDSEIAALLNRLGKQTGKGNSWTQARIRAFRNDHEITVYQNGEREARGEINLKEAAKELGVSIKLVARIVKDSILPAKQICPGAPWTIRRVDLKLPEVQRAIQGLLPRSTSQKQLSIFFQ
jgi:DNA invertase Pin-like site-specific DNA recombinase